MLNRRRFVQSSLAAAVAYAAARRPVHFHVSNEFADWNTIHHTFTYTHAVDQAMRRVSRVMGCEARAVPLPFAEAAIDVDKPADLALVEAILAKRAA